MKLYVFFLTLLFLAPLILQAQSNYKPGLVVTLEGDTVRGFINYKEWSVSPTSVTFKYPAPGGAVKIFDVTHISYFEIAGFEAYRRYEGVVTMNPVAIDRLAFNAKPQLDSVVVFIKVNYNGDLVDLLSYKDWIKTRFFIQEKDGSQPQELYYNRYYADYNGNQMLTQRGYVGQLQLLANKYNVSTTIINKQIEIAQYNEADFRSIISKINIANDSSPAPDGISNSIRYFAGIALNSSTVRMQGIDGVSEPDSNPASLMPLLAFGMDFFLNKHIQKFYVRMEGVFTAASYHVDNTIDIGQVSRQYTYKISQQSFAVCPQIVYSLYNTYNFKLNAGVVGQFNFSKYSQDSYLEAYTYTYKNNSKPPIKSAYEYQGYRSLMPFWFSYAFQSGAVIKGKYEIYARHMPYSSVTGNSNNSSSIDFRSFYFGVNYLFHR